MEQETEGRKLKSSSNSIYRSILGSFCPRDGELLRGEGGDIWGLGNFRKSRDRGAFHMENGTLGNE